jgi:hypothetical protein
MVIFGLNSTVLVCPATIFRWIEANENISVASSSYQFIIRYNARAQNLLVYDVVLVLVQAPPFPAVCRRQPLGAASDFSTSPCQKKLLVINASYIPGVGRDSWLTKQSRNGRKKKPKRNV